MKDFPPRDAVLRRLGESLLAAVELWQVVDRFSYGPDGLARRESDLQEMILTGRFRDPAELAQVRRVLENWGGGLGDPAPVPRSGLLARTSWLSRFAAQRWDFRLGMERDRIPMSDEMLSPTVAEDVYGLARAWNLCTPIHVEGHFDHVIVLGGLLQANLNRPMAAAELITRGSVESRSVVGLSAVRPMSDSEARLASAVGCHATTEVAALEAGLGKAFGLGKGDWQQTDRGNVRRAHRADGLAVTSVSVPRRPSGGRADTGATIAWLVSETGLVRSGQSILCVTDTIHQVAAHVAVLARMPADVRLVTVGMEPAQVPPALQRDFRSQHYLQEIKSTIDAFAQAIEPTASCTTR